MYVCMYVCMYCMYVCMYCMYAWVYACMYVCMYRSPEYSQFLITTTLVQNHFVFTF